MLESNWVDNEGNRLKLSRHGWTRAARTDAGVHALFNVISLKLLYKKELFCDPVTGVVLPESRAMVWYHSVVV